MYSSTELYPNAHVAEAVHEYCVTHSTPLPDVVHKHREKSIEFAKSVGMDPYMMINTLQAQFLMFLAKITGAKKVLEVGTFTGYSALAWAEAVKGQEEAKVVCCDIPGAHTEFAKKTLEDAGFLNGLVTFVEGDGVESIQSLPIEQFDIIFLDANKDGYVPCLKAILKRGLLSPSGLVIADNALSRGLVADSSDKNPHAANTQDYSYFSYKHLIAFNKFVQDSDELEQVVLPVFDGLNICKLK